ncbi:hypothetical protein ONS95_008368 [Cadophora gregata]|uniref:uncharacterized protein n=1 Tax=Cadophora gregata TaxID=51156 RepID=UPI0026DC434F|nr:uncharacterized protein ONS95_008368 [Cadophora gregata]KAK0100420.1 hypothetical protein ONS96_007697 [Cadophora gregata f. sp. sojae]KAK0126788.1 hypothetical protein ONS95_008368 [Cadophora gregata]
MDRRDSASAPNSIQMAALPRPARTLPRPSPALNLSGNPILPSFKDPEVCLTNFQDQSHTRTGRRRLICFPKLNLLNRKLARLTFQAMVAFGVLTIVYQGISLIPAFQSSRTALRALGIQWESARDGRQTLVFGFLQECASRKAQGLPLGNDCEKYLARTPKAPPDIEEWLEATPLGNVVRVLRKIRDLVYTGSDGSGTLHPDTPSWVSGGERQQEWSKVRLYLVMALIVFVLLCVAKSRRFRSDVGRIRSTAHILYGPFAMIASSSLATWIIYSVVFGGTISLGIWIYFDYGIPSKIQRWDAVFEFLEECNFRENHDIPLGDDCIIYASRRIVPRPSTGIAYHAVTLLCLTISVTACVLSITSLVMQWSTTRAMRSSFSFDSSSSDHWDRMRLMFESTPFRSSGNVRVSDPLELHLWTRLSSPDSDVLLLPDETIFSEDERTSRSERSERARRMLGYEDLVARN